VLSHHPKSGGDSAEDKACNIFDSARAIRPFLLKYDVFILHLFFQFTLQFRLVFLAQASSDINTFFFDFKAATLLP
jgi:hypothetical protein